MDTAWFISDRGPNASHVQYGANGDWYIRSAANAGIVVLQDQYAGANVGIGTSNPLDKLHVFGVIRVDSLGTGGGSNTLCRNASNQISTCGSSARYKTNIAPLAMGLDVIEQLRPVTFDWKESGEADLGFVAEEVDQVTPLLTTRNAAGEIEGVKYDRVSAVLVNAVQEQQAQIAELEAQISDLKQGAGGSTAPLSTPWPWLVLALTVLGMAAIFRKPRLIKK
jgi:hypothetical protein